MKHICKKAFTLAEILITLTLVGVLASLTIPSLVNNIDDQQNRVAWKKTFSDLSQMYQRVLVDNGGDFTNACPSLNHNCLMRSFASYLNYIKSCDAGVVFGNCWHKAAGEVKHLSGEPKTYTPEDGFSGLILSNSTMLILYHYSSDCTSTAFSNTIKKCSSIYVDVNGFKSPNVLGKDIFNIHLTKDRLLPFGVQNDGNENYCEGSTGGVAGLGCAAKYLYQ